MIDQSFINKVQALECGRFVCDTLSFLAIFLHYGSQYFSTLVLNLVNLGYFCHTSLVFFSIVGLLLVTLVDQIQNEWQQRMQKST